MKINIGSYLEMVIRNSRYSKKDICNELNERYSFGAKPLSYTTFSNNLKEGNITINEAIGLATILNIDFNKVVNAYKNKYQIENLVCDDSKLKSIVADIVTTESSIKGVTYTDANVYPFKNGGEEPTIFEVMYVSEDGNVAIHYMVHLDCYLDGSEDVGYLVQDAYFTNFLDILGESDMSIKDFYEMSVDDRLYYLLSEGESALAILGESPIEVEFRPSKYFNKVNSSSKDEITETNKVIPEEAIKNNTEGGLKVAGETVMDNVCHSNANILVDYIMDNKDNGEFASAINSDKYNGDVDKYIDAVLYNWRNVAPFDTFEPMRFFDILK